MSDANNTNPFDMNLVDMQEEANRLIAQGLLTGHMLLQSGQIVRLSDAQLLRLIALVKSTKITDIPPSAAFLIPSDFTLPTSDPMHQPHQPDISPIRPHADEEQDQVQSQDKPHIDFDALERQINKNINP